MGVYERSHKSEPLWCRVCPVCKRQMLKVTDQCHGEYPVTIWVVPEEQHAGAVETERTRIIARLVEMADALDQDAVAGTAETLRRAAAVLDIEGGR